MKYLLHLLALPLLVASGSINSTANSKSVDLQRIFTVNTETNNGECYVTKGQHHVCLYRLGNRTFTVAINLPNKSDPYPTILYIKCGGEWRGYGNLNQTEGDRFVRAFCEDN